MTAMGFSPVKAYTVITKPIGPLCNLDCKYCFYLEKENLFPRNENFKMSEEVLESYVRQYIESQNVPEVTFAWQGGEPTLMGINFFRKAVEFQRRYANGKTIYNAFQTNGTLLNDEWAAFLAEHKFLVGISVDGPAHLHNLYRYDKQGGDSHAKVMRGINLLRKHGVEFNTLTVVNRQNSQYPLEVYRFLKEIGSTFIQFIPLVERNANNEAKKLGISLATPPDANSKVPDDSPVTDWSVEPEQYGEFLNTVFNEWHRHDVGKVFVQLFEVTIANHLGLPPGLCVFAPTCGKALAMEHNGDVYSCDHYVYPQYKLGNILANPLGDMLDLPEQQKFGRDKELTLPRYCKQCDVRFLCHGECPKHRFLQTPDGESGLNYLCAGYQKFFRHSMKPLHDIAADLRRR